jgi:hypothetical protein
VSGCVVDAYDDGYVGVSDLLLRHDHGDYLANGGDDDVKNLVARHFCSLLASGAAGYYDNCGGYD